MPPFDEREILRYAGGKGEIDGETKALLAACIQECANKLSYRVTHLILPKAAFLEKVRGAKESKGLSAALCDCEEVAVFAATVGIEMDRLLTRYASVSPAKALFFQAIGAERIEALCDAFCGELCKQGRYPRRRFSPGYGDFPLEAQRDILGILDAARKIGVGLTDSLLMTPTKSVTAVAGLGKSPADEKKGCASCLKKDCEYRL